MKRGLLIAISILMCTLMFAQEKKVMEFKERNHDFGTVREEVGKVTYIFRFINTSLSPLTLKSVKASCGCTTPVWSKAPVGPGEMGEITVSYNTKGRPGTFQKSITIIGDAGNGEFVDKIFIKGQVLPASDTELVPIKHKN
ncbi:MAG: DUF1573 domain-containing protein [Paludibacteraceae bacterium]|nr:DUF1573 domain-containing protein [Paludibacteraceae bacterium]